MFSTAGAGVKTNLLFFTKGSKTERIWYYDLSWVKVGKKTPLTLAHFGFAVDGSVLDDAALPAALVAEWKADESHAGQAFPSYARMLSQRGKRKGESRYSWTVDFAVRRADAREAMQPLQDQARRARAEAVELKEKLKGLKREKKPGAEISELIAALELRIGEREKASRDLEGQAAVIDAATFDLKAVNPNAVTVVDNRTPTQVIASIEAQARTVADALGRLKALLQQSRESREECG